MVAGRLEREERRYGLDEKGAMAWIGHRPMILPDASSFFDMATARLYLVPSPTQQGRTCRAHACQRGTTAGALAWHHVAVERVLLNPHQMCKNTDTPENDCASWKMR
jgi:hypothetical protein